MMLCYGSWDDFLLARPELSLYNTFRLIFG